MRKLLATPASNSAHHTEGKIDSIEIARAKLGKLEAIHERMRRVNALVRNRNARGLKDLGYTEAEVIRLLQPDDACPRVFYSDYKLKNNWQQIQALRRLIRDLEGTPVADALLDCSHYEYREDLDEAVISFRFAAKPDKAMRGALRRSGFALSPSRNTYERCLDSDGIAAAFLLRSTLAKRLH